MDALTYRLEFHGSLSHLLEGFLIMVSPYRPPHCGGLSECLCTLLNPVTIVIIIYLIKFSRQLILL